MFQVKLILCRALHHHSTMDPARDINIPQLFVTSSSCLAFQAICGCVRVAAVIYNSDIIVHKSM